MQAGCGAQPVSCPPEIPPRAGPCCDPDPTFLLTQGCDSAKWSRRLQPPLAPPGPASPRTCGGTRQQGRGLLWSGQRCPPRNLRRTTTITLAAQRATNCAQGPTKNRNTDTEIVANIRAPGISSPPPRSTGESGGSTTCSCSMVASSNRHSMSSGAPIRRYVAVRRCLLTTTRREASRRRPRPDVVPSKRLRHAAFPRS